MIILFLRRTVSGSNCKEATAPISPSSHLHAWDGLVVEKISFSSCYKPETVEGSTFWRHVREGGPDLWIWMGDNMYKDGYDMDAKRLAYNAAREEASYLLYGPVAHPAIPVMATWDDHDCCSNNEGNEYPCIRESQKEFAIHLGINSTDPRHWEYPGVQQEGVYSSSRFRKPFSEEVGLQVMVLDARSGRDPTYSQYGECRGTNTRMLSEEQWSWLEEKLRQRSEVKVIVSGTQVLPPTDLTRGVEEFCAHDSHSGGGNSFMDAISAVGEGVEWKGTEYETWAEVPLERLKLLGLAQKTINDGYADAVIFLSGDQHWGELMAKQMPASPLYGDPRVLYEVTASGIMQNWPYDIENSNRVRERSADLRGSGPFIHACSFPFIYGGTVYTTCTGADADFDWCSLEVDAAGAHIPGRWGVCAPPDQEPAQALFSNSSQTCSGSKFHVCSALGNYGSVAIDYRGRRVRMSVESPLEGELVYHEIVY